MYVCTYVHRYMHACIHMDMLIHYNAHQDEWY